MVEPVDPHEPGELDGLERPPRPLPLNHLRLEEPDHRFDEGIVVGITTAPNGRRDAGVGETADAAHRESRRVGHAPIGASARSAAGDGAVTSTGRSAALCRSTRPRSGPDGRRCTPPSRLLGPAVECRLGETRGRGLEDLVGRFSSRFSRSNATRRSRSLVVNSAGRWPVSRAAWRTHLRKVSAVVPSFGATACSAAHSDGCAGRCSITSRTARSRTSGENRLGRPINPILPRNEVSENPGTLH